MTKIGIVGLGRMGGNLARHALEEGHEVVGYNRNRERTRELAPDRLYPASSLEELIAQLAPPRFVLLYVPHGNPTEDVCTALRPLLSSDDIVADGGNSYWPDSRRRHDWFAQVGVRFLDIGTSGGVNGARWGAAFMVGGDRAAFDTVAPVLRDLAVDDEAVYFAGGPGTGHFVKLVHNAIEFGMVQAIAEGVELLDRSGYELDMPGLFRHWNHGSVIRSWLIELMSNALAEHPDFSDLSTYVEDTEEVKWMVQWALEQDIPIPVVSQAQTALMQYRDLGWPQSKAVALLRNQYGGHKVHKATEHHVGR